MNLLIAILTMYVNILVVNSENLSLGPINMILVVVILLTYLITFFIYNKKREKNLLAVSVFLIISLSLYFLAYIYTYY